MAYENTTLMYHQLSCQSQYEKQLSIEEFSNQLKKDQEKLDKIILENTKITKEKLKGTNEKKQDWYMDVKEALKYGVIDEIIYPIEDEK